MIDMFNIIHYQMKDLIRLQLTTLNIPHSLFYKIGTKPGNEAYKALENNINGKNCLT